MNQPSEDSSTIFIDFYQGAYGPTIRIDVQESSHLEKLRDTMLQLARERLSSVNLSEMEQVKTIRPIQFLLKLVPVHRRGRKCLERHLGVQGEMLFCWSMAADGWERCAELIDGLLKSPGPAHQYLSEEGIDDALVEVAFSEERIVEDPETQGRP